jgi:hypothetical protein
MGKNPQHHAHCQDVQENRRCPNDDGPDHDGYGYRPLAARVVGATTSCAPMRAWKLSNRIIMSQPETIVEIQVMV